MAARRNTLLTALTAMLAGCAQDSAGPQMQLAPSFAKAAGEQQTIVVNPNANGNGIAATIQEGIDRVAPGGKVLVRPGVYPEALVIDKGLTLESIGDGGDPVILAPAPGPVSAVEITAIDAVSIRGLTVQFAGFAGIRGVGPVDLRVEHTVILGPSRTGIIVFNEAPAPAPRAHLIVRDSRIEGPTTNPTVAINGGITARGDVDALIERNVVRGSGAACITVLMRSDLSGETNAELVGNDLDGCGDAGAIRIASSIAAPGQPVTAIGFVHVIGNTIRNTPGSCGSRTGINWEVFGGLIERNSIAGFVQACAGPGNRALPAAVWVGSRLNYPPTAPLVQFNDIEGNAQAGLRLGPNQTMSLVARCNWWGSVSGPSGLGSGTGDAIVVELGATTPVFVPFATAPIAGTGATGC